MIRRENRSNKRTPSQPWSVQTNPGPAAQISTVAVLDKGTPGTERGGNSQRRQGIGKMKKILPWSQVIKNWTFCP